MFKELKLSFPTRNDYIEEKGNISPDALVFIEDEGVLVTPFKEYQFVTKKIFDSVVTTDDVEKAIDNALFDDITNGHEFVDMGDAGIWATCNLGAIKPEEYGLYFQWGDTKGYIGACQEWESDSSENNHYFGWSRYKFLPYLNKYNSTDGLTTLELEDDAAHVNMGGKWRMPTQEELINLCNLCNTEWVEDYNSSGISGRIFKLKTDESKQLFFPAAGFCGDSSFNGDGSFGSVWSSSLNSYNNSNAYYLYFNIGNDANLNNNRCLGYNVRGFIPANTKAYKYLPTEEANKTFATKEEVNKANETFVVEMAGNGALKTSQEECVEIYKKLLLNPDATVLLKFSSSYSGSFAKPIYKSSGYSGYGYFSFLYEAYVGRYWELKIAEINGQNTLQFVFGSAQDFTVGKNLEMTSNRTLNVTGIEEVYYVEATINGELITSKEECAAIYEKLEANSNATIYLKLSAHGEILKPSDRTTNGVVSGVGTGYSFVYPAGDTYFMLCVTPLENSTAHGGLLIRRLLSIDFTPGYGLEMTGDRVLNVVDNAYVVEANTSNGFFTSKEECSEIYEAIIDNPEALVLFKLNGIYYRPYKQSIGNNSGFPSYSFYYKFYDNSYDNFVELSMDLRPKDCPMQSYYVINPYRFGKEFTPGKGLEMTPDRTLNVTLDTTPFIVVDSLPDTPESGNEGKLHLVLNADGKDDNLYDEYLWVNGNWEKIGTAKLDVDLTQYQQKLKGLYVSDVSNSGGSINITKKSYYDGAESSKTIDFKTLGGKSLFGQGDIKLSDLNEFDVLDATVETINQGLGQVNNHIQSIYKEWYGTKSQYKALGTYDSKTKYFILEDGASSISTLELNPNKRIPLLELEENDQKQEEEV